MNNEYETARVSQSEEETKPEPEQANPNLVRIQLLQRITSNRDFKLFVKNILVSRLETARNTLKTSTDQIKMHQMQGAIRELEYIVEDLPAELIALKNTIDHA